MKRRMPVPNQIVVWDVPLEEFAAWQDFTGNRERTFEQYQDYLQEVRALCAELGCRCVLLRVSVAQMQAELERQGWPNLPEWRAAALSLLAAK